jgi:DnaJ-class molecular chaperone
MEIKVRGTCTHCNGSGKAMTDAEAKQCARDHSRAAMLCHHPNLLSAADFVVCTKCNGTGKQEQWLPLPEFKTLLEKL